MHRRSFLAGLSLGCGLLPPVLAWAREPVATVLGRTLYRDELRGGVEGLRQAILAPLLLRFAAEQKLSVTDAEIDEFSSAMKMPPFPAGLSAAERAELRRIPEGMVLDWKISKALYQRYGGEVIFQQANPMEPVGAMRQFLQEQEKRGAFTIQGTADRDGFYDYFVRAQHGGGAAFARELRQAMVAPVGSKDFQPLPRYDAVIAPFAVRVASPCPLPAS